MVRFAVRKRGRKAVRKVAAAADDSDGDGGGAWGEAALMREAQRLREQARQSALALSEERVRDTAPAAGDDGGAVEEGLRTNFAMERSGVAVEERMDMFVEEKMRERYGGEEEDVRGGEADENDLYVIPAHLKVPRRPLYDPGEGLPAAGVEEVELGEEVRLRNEEETKHARAELTAAQESGRGRRPELVTSGNVSANFMKHRKEWIEMHVGGRPDDSASGRGAQGAAEGGTGAGGRGGREGGNAGSKRPPQATDMMIADRFRKRWRR